MTTIKDLARILNISPSTVSRAINGSTEISSETTKKVLELAEKMNYILPIGRQRGSLGLTGPRVE